jgi:hypothetical protein
MAIVKRQSQTPLVVNPGTSITATFSSTPIEGSLLIAAFAPYAAHSGATAPGGWTLAESKDQATAAVSIGIYYRVAGASEPTGVTFTYSPSSRLALHTLEYTGLLTSSPLDVTADNEGGAGGVTSLASGTTAATAQARELAFVAFAHSATGRTYTNGFTEQTATNDLGTAHKLVEATGAQSTTGSWTGSNPTAAAIATFKAIPDLAGTW